MELLHPQSEIKIISDYSCLAQCYIYCCGIEPDTKHYFNIVYDAVCAGAKKSGIGADCTVEDATLFIKWLTGRTIPVYKKVIATITAIKERCPVEYDRIVDGKKLTHFVVVENGEIVFNPLAFSNCVEYGRPVSARILDLAKYEI